MIISKADRTRLSGWRALVFGIAAVVVSSFAGAGLAAPASAVLRAAGPAESILAMVNQARAAQGLHGLLQNPSMDAVAAAWANQMAANGAMTHNPDFATQIPAGWSRAGENVAEGYPTPQAMFNGWMNSPGHKANILGDYTDIGIAFITANGKTWGVQDFGKYAGHVGPPPPAPAPPVQAPPAVAPPAAPAPQSSPEPSPEASAEPSAAPTPSPSAAQARSSADAPMSNVHGDDSAGTPAGAELLGAPLLLWIAAVILLGGMLLLFLRLRGKNRPR